MIDIENRIYTGTVEAVKYVDDKVSFASVYTNTPTSYPFVSIEEISNACYRNSQDDSSSERHAVLGYEINIYCQGYSAKSDAKKLAGAVDNYLLGLDFNRVSKVVLPIDAKTIRICLRYEGVSDGDGNIYRR